MELSQEFLIDMGINAVGYLLAGVISVFIYNLFRKDKKEKSIDEVVVEKQEEQLVSEPSVQVETKSENKVEFITFGANKNIEQAVPRNRMEEAQVQPSSKMSRKEAINLAKKMLVAGASEEKIKKILPVSDAELALLSLNIN